VNDSIHRVAAGELQSSKTVDRNSGGMLCSLRLEDHMKCLLHLGVHAKDGSAGIEREIDIPFCPAAGLEITGIVNPDGNLSCGKVSSVQWDAQTGKLTVHLENDDNEVDDDTLAEKLSDWGDGWNVSIYR
jgi:hypothetical protein